MIPILYDKYEKLFDHNGIGRLSDTISCTVTEELNGEYTLFMEYPIDGKYFDEIEVDSIIGAYSCEDEKIQLFMVSQMEVNMNTVTIEANHISYRLSGIPVRSFSNKTTLNAAINAITTNTVTNIKAGWEALGFTLTTDMTVTGKSYENEKPQSVMKCLGEVLEKFGGDLYRDNFDIKILESRGSDNGASIRYAKNMTAVDAQYKTAANGYYYYYSSGDETVEPWKAGESESSHPYPYFEIKDASVFYDEKPSMAQVVEDAQSASQNLALKKTAIEVSFVNLGNLPEYADLAALETVNMGDTVHVYHEGLGLDYTSRVVKTVFNVLTENYDSVSIGTVQESLADTIASSGSSSTGVGIQGPKGEKGDPGPPGPKGDPGGTDFKYAQGTGTASSSNVGTSVTQVPLATISIMNGEFSIESGGIKVSESGLYKITAACYIRPTNSTTQYGAYIKVGTSLSAAKEVNETLLNKPTDRYGPGAVPVAPKLVNLNAGDIIFLCARCVGAAGTCDPNNTATYLLIEKIS